MLASLTSDYDILFGSTNGFNESPLSTDENTTDRGSIITSSSIHANNNLELAFQLDPSSQSSTAPSSPERPRGCPSTLSGDPMWSFVAGQVQVCSLDSCEDAETALKSSISSSSLQEEEETKPAARRRAASVKDCRRLTASNGVRLRRTKTETFTSYQLYDEEMVSVSDMTVKAVLQTPFTVYNSWHSTVNVDGQETENVRVDKWSTVTEPPSFSSSIDTHQPDISSLMKRKAELEDNMNRLHLQMLESLREEWLITGLIPEGFEEYGSSIIAFNPSLTSFPLSHLLSHGRTESALVMGSSANLKQSWMNVDMEQSNILKKGGYCASESNQSDASSGNDSLNSSFASAVKHDEMEFSMEWSCYKSECISIDSRHHLCAPVSVSICEKIEEKLEALEQDYKIVDQLYKVHKQRAAETNVAAYRNAFKCNAQKLQEITRTKAKLIAQLNQAKEERLHAAEMLTQPTSLSSRNIRTADCQSVHSSSSTFDESCLATLPRCRPSISGTKKAANFSGPFRWGRKNNVKSSIGPLAASYFEEKGDKAIYEVDKPDQGAPPIISKVSRVAWTGSLGRRFSQTARQLDLKNASRSRMSLLPKMMNRPKEVEINRSEKNLLIAESFHEDGETIEGVDRINEKVDLYTSDLTTTNTPMQRSLSSPSVVPKPCQDLEQTLVGGDLVKTPTRFKSPLETHSHVSTHAYENKDGEKEGIDKEDTVKSATLKRTTDDDHSKMSSSTISLSTLRSSSGCYSFTSHTSCMLSSTNTASEPNHPVDSCPEVCFRKQPTRHCVNTAVDGAFQSTTNSIRCICSCISEQCGAGCGSVTVDCDCGYVATKASDESTQSMTPVVVSRADALFLNEAKVGVGRRSLNPLAYFRIKAAITPTDGKVKADGSNGAPPRIRKSLWQRARYSMLPVNK